MHCWQYNGLGTCPGGLIEGIADYIRLKDGLAPPHWTRGGKHWDDGYVSPYGPESMNPLTCAKSGIKSRLISSSGASKNVV